MTDKEALHAAAALLGAVDGNDGGQEKTASEDNVSTADVFQELGKEAFRELVKEAQDEANLAEVEEGFEKVAGILILDAAERGVLEDMVKTASEGDSELAEAMWTLLTED